MLQMQQIRKKESKFFQKKSVASVISVDKSPVEWLNECYLRSDVLVEGKFPVRM